MEKAEAINQYVCEGCGYVTTTVNRAEGTTPFLILCPRRPKCRGMARSRFYRVAPGVVPSYEWYRPEGEPLAKLNLSTREHVELGGLLLRPIADRPKGPPILDAVAREHARRYYRIAQKLMGDTKRRSRRAGRRGA